MGNDFEDEAPTGQWIRQGDTGRYPAHMVQTLLALQRMIDHDAEPTQVCPIITDEEAIEGLNKMRNLNSEARAPKAV